MLAKRVFRSFLDDSNGATAIEYGILAAIIGLGGVASMTGLGATVKSVFEYVLREFLKV